MRVREFRMYSSSGDISTIIKYDADKYFTAYDCDDENLNNEKDLPLLDWQDIISEEPDII